MRAGRRKKIKLGRKDLDIFVADGFDDILLVSGADGVLHNNINHKEDESDTDENSDKWRVVRDWFFRTDEGVEK